MRHTAQPFFDPAAQRVRRGSVTRAAAAWLQPRLVLQTAGGLTAELRADLLDGEAKGSDYFGPYREDDRVRLTLRYRF